MTKMKWILGALVLAGGMSSIAHAGLHEGAQVVINDPASQATGSVGTSHNTADSQQYIGCDIDSFAGFRSVHCYARDASGLPRGCTSTANEIVTAAGAITPDSHILFRWNSSGQCAQLSVRNSSTWEPKK